ncbi:zinc-dependent alcohol dehydrogenase [Streptomyces flavofungini]|uniref:zinc-dependent alcohol dehydrogenase n=1 Tax=Streptomyces flavofungini TaxID=68200 RepID=UPI0034DE47D1
MRSLEFVAPRRLRLVERPEPRVTRAHEAVVAPVAATTCDLDRAVIAGATPFEGPFALGHECVGRVVDLGSECGDLSAGDLVVVPWHISCGTCAQCSVGHPSHCERTPRYAMFGLPLGGQWGGMFTERIKVPWAGANLRRLPEGLPAAAAAAASDSLTDAYDAVRRGLALHPGRGVAVLGGLTHGLYACAFAACLGAADVVYVDRDARRRSIAEGYGAQAVDDVRELGGRRFPATVDATGDPGGLTGALEVTAPGGHCHSFGIFFKPAPLPLFTMYMDAITFSTGRPEIGPHLPEVLDLVRTGEVDPLPVYSDTIAYDDLPEALLELPAKPLVLLG